jgi:stringent starvation protein B
VQPPQLPPKKDVLLALLERSSVYVHLDPRRDGVRVPEWFNKQPQLILQIGLNLPVPIRDLEVDDEAVSCTLSFSRTPHSCYLPWPSVYAIVGEDRRGMVWPDDVPAEVAAQQAAQVRTERKKRAQPKLRAVSGKDDDRPTPAENAPARVTPMTAGSRNRQEVPEEGVSSTHELVGDESLPPASDKPKGRELPPYLRVVK